MSLDCIYRGELPPRHFNTAPYCLGAAGPPPGKPVPGLRTCPPNARCWRRPARKMHVPIWPDSAGRGGGAGVSPRGLLTNVHAEPNFITLSYISQNLAPQRPGTRHICSPIVHMRGLCGPCAAPSIQPACAVRGHLSAKLWKTLAFRLRSRRATAILRLSTKQF